MKPNLRTILLALSVLFFLFCAFGVPAAVGWSCLGMAFFVASFIPEAL